MSGASTPIERTLSVLVANQSTEASHVLTAAVFSSHFGLARAAAKAICQNPSNERITAICARSHELSEAACVEFAANAMSLESGLKAGLQHQQAEVRASTVEFLRRTANFHFIPALLGFIGDKSQPLFAPAGQAIRDISLAVANCLADQPCGVLAKVSSDLLQRKRFELLSELDQHAEKIDDLDAPEVLVEAVLLLGDLQCSAVMNLLDKRGNACRQLVREALLKGDHPRFINIICQNLSLPEPHRKIEQVFLSRSDVAFVTAMLRGLPEKPSDELRRYLGQLDELPWLKVDHPTWNALEPKLHPKLVILIDALGLEPALRLELKKWILSNSGPEGRAAVGNLFSELPDEQVQEVLYDALADENPEVEAWATKQLRSQQLPDTFPQLLKRLSASNDIVREAARGELADFSLEKLYAFLPKMPKSTSLKCAEVLLKVNPETPRELKEEMGHAFRWKKVRAARAAAALGLVDDVLDAIAHMSEDPESSVRRTALEALAESHSQLALTVAEKRLDDPNRNVRQAAQAALDQIRQHLKA